MLASNTHLQWNFTEVSPNPVVILENVSHVETNVTETTTYVFVTVKIETFRESVVSNVRTCLRLKSGPVSHRGNNFKIKEDGDDRHLTVS